MDDLSALLAQLSPEELQQLLNLSTIGGQMQQAQAVGGQEAPQGHRTMLGGILGGIGAGGANLASGLKMGQLRGQQQGGLQQLLDLLRQKQEPQAGDFPMPDMGGGGYG